MSGSQRDGRPRRRRWGTACLALDFDGVITISQPADGPTLSALQRFQPDRVARLNRLVEFTGCRVVATTSWRWNSRARAGLTVAQLNQVLHQAGFTGEVVDITPAFSEEENVWDIEEHRGAEILSWCQTQPVPPRALAVLDDLRLRGAVEPYLVRTDARVGLSDADVDRAAELLRARPLRVPWVVEKEAGAGDGVAQ